MALQLARHGQPGRGADNMNEAQGTGGLGRAADAHAPNIDGGGADGWSAMIPQVSLPGVSWHPAEEN